ncbi:MAG: ANTAR domain-containing protein [Candidatus Rokubacteria bacterium]|nr:ANTAR domain-containing protein [Candidatus Rokubacteria bacterium]
MDDHAPSRKTLAEAIEAAGGAVVGDCERAGEAVALVTRHRPDVAVLAVGLSDGDGTEAARRIAAEAPCAVVLLTSRTGPLVWSRAVEAGVLGFLTKPLRTTELPPALDVAVSRFREMDAVRRENETLRAMLESRKLVERAKGLLMARLGLSEPEAFRRIRKTAMDSRKPMADIARALLLAENVTQSPAPK